MFSFMTNDFSQHLFVSNSRRKFKKVVTVEQLIKIEASEKIKMHFYFIFNFNFEVFFSFSVERIETEINIKWFFNLLIAKRKIKMEIRFTRLYSQNYRFRSNNHNFHSRPLNQITHFGNIEKLFLIFLFLLLSICAWKLLRIKSQE